MLYHQKSIIAQQRVVIRFVSIVLCVAYKQIIAVLVVGQYFKKKMK
jgi:hypothetical protein